MKTAHWFVFLALLAVGCNSAHSVSRAALPFGSVDSPHARDVVHGKVTVAGWALAEQPIEQVTIYVDGNYLMDASRDQPRPDVAQAKPQFAGADKSGWLATLDTQAIAPGWHELVVQARSSAGGVRDLATLPVLVQR